MAVYVSRNFVLGIIPLILISKLKGLQSLLEQSQSIMKNCEDSIFFAVANYCMKVIEIKLSEQCFDVRNKT
jgi:hypothetical protein